MSGVGAIEVRCASVFLLLLSWAASAQTQGSERVEPARWRQGGVPEVAALAVSGGQVFLEVVVSPAGRVRLVTPLRTTQGFTDGIVAAVKAWTFQAATRITDPPEGLRVPKIEPIESRVLVAAIIRPPVLVGPTIGAVPADVAKASSETVYPISVKTPGFPPQAIAAGTVLVDATVDGNGRVIDATVLRSSPPFDGPALDATRGWSFSPASIGGTPVTTHAYLIYVFAQPITTQRKPGGIGPLQPGW